MSLVQRYQKDPFRIFFTLGFVLGILGVLPWVLLLFHWQIYPVNYHRMVMIGGFLTSFVTGFLMTSVPRFTQSHFARTKEISISFVAILLAYIFAALGYSGAFYAAVLVSHVNLSIFAIKRFRLKKANPPSTFFFIGIGFLIWVASDLMLFLLSTFIQPDPNLFLLFKNLWVEGAVLSFVLGVGGRLVPGIFGLSEIVQGQRNVYEQQASYLSVIPKSLFVAAAVFVLSYWVEVFINLQAGLVLRGLVVAFFALRYWKIYKLPVIRSRLSMGIWIAGWSFTIGYLIRVLWISGSVHALHIIFVGGFTLITVMIATRVTLAHSSLGTTLEKKSFAINAVIFFILVATLTRVLSILWPAVYFAHLAYAAIFLIIALVIWLIRFFKILI